MAVSATPAALASNADMFPCVYWKRTQNVTAPQAHVCSPGPTDPTTSLSHTGKYSKLIIHTFGVGHF